MVENAKKLIVFNWKMAPNSTKEARRLLGAIIDSKFSILNSEIVVVLPFVYLPFFANFCGLKRESTRINKKEKRLSLKLGSQDVFWEKQGAFTGEISTIMLKNLGVEYVLIGHSERRKYLNETDEVINKKVLAGLEAGLKVILCVGEPEMELRIKNKGLKKTKNYIKKQLEKDLKNILLNYSKSRILNSRLAIVYEPVWAISANNTGKTCKPEDALEIIKFIKKTLNSKFSILNFRVLYGGSIDSKNIGDFLKYPEIDGVLIGGASLKIKEVEKILK